MASMPVPCQRFPIQQLSDIQRPSGRLFSTCGGAVYSYIGRRPLSVPTGVEVTHDPKPFTHEDPRFQNTSTFRVKGPLGEEYFPLQSFVTVADCPLTEDDKAMNRRRMTVTVQDPMNKQQRAMWGTTRTIIQNLINGVSEGFTVPLRLVGVGYRATIEKSKANPSLDVLSLKVGYSHAIDMEVPKGISATTPNPTRIVLKGSNWEQLRLFAANIRAKRKPEPYNQKGIFVGDETIKKKAGKKK
ncbi:54S ribosomal protein L6 mitochondrial [Dimargaris xerosporica]|nr:54S ribosomal protein L6 mitochondrial [Dimargaris xerosporica]